MYDKQFLTQSIKEYASTLGFSACGITPVSELSEEKTHFLEWLKAGYHGELAYMERNQHLRFSPAQLVEGTRSIIVVLVNYYTENKQPDDAPRIARYAYGKDYHFVVKDKLKALLAHIQEIEPSAEGRFFADSAPVLEHALACRAGLGWIGKNSLLVTRQGSYFFIGELLLNLELEYDIPQLANYCGNCRKCVEACPTQAIVKEGVVDASKCISYHTIERKGEIPVSANIENRIFGCDICQEVCPWNRKASPHNHPEFMPGAFIDLDKSEWENLTKEDFKKYFSKSPLERAGYNGLKKSIEHTQKYKKRQSDE